MKVYQIIFTLLTLILMSGLSSFAQSKITQKAVVNFPQNGRVEVEIRETIKQTTTISFWKDQHKTKLAALELPGDSFDFAAADNPFCRFQTVKTGGLPQPLVEVTCVSPGGSDNSFTTVLIGEKNGKFKIISPKITHETQGGVHIGSLGKNNGYGFAVWNFIWGKTEVHYDSHKYQVDLYRFDAKTEKFVKSKNFVSRKSATAQKALQSLGFSSFKNTLSNIAKIKKFQEI